LDIRPLLSTVNATLGAHRNAKKLYGRRLAPNFHVFDFARSDEIGLSKVIGWLIDPAGTHDQGDRFLRLFLEKLGLSWPEEFCQRAKIRLEESSDLGRVDIVLRSGSYLLFLENKPYAGDQPNQLERYFDILKNSGAPHSCIVYLTNDGREPSDGSLREKKQELLTDKKLKLWSYRIDIVEWLAQCRAVCEADRVTIFIDEFSKFVVKKFGGATDMAETDHMIDSIMKSPENVSASFEIIAIRNELRKRLMSKLEDQVKERATDLGWTSEWYGDRSANQRYYGLSIRFSESCPYTFSLEFQNTQYSGPCFGLKREKENMEETAGEGAACREKIGRARTSPWWLWSRDAGTSENLLFLEPNWDQSAAPWVQISDESMADQIVSVAAKFRDVLKSCGLIVN
jgi:PD-(D/E)XK nuclease superfamily